MKRVVRLMLGVGLVAALSACGGEAAETVAEDGVPMNHPKDFEPISDGGKLAYDTVLQELPAFSFTDQEGQTITERDIAGKVHVVDFFFTSCQTICPIMKGNMLDVYAKFKDNEQVVLLSHSIDPERDTVQALKAYADGLGISADRWHLLTGDFDEVYDLAEIYRVTAKPDNSAPGGFLHGGAFLLLDENRMIRDYYDGTKKEEVARMMADMDKLLNAK